MEVEKSLNHTGARQPEKRHKAFLHRNLRRLGSFVVQSLLVLSMLSACAPAAQPASGKLRVLAIESYLADMVQNVAGQRAAVDTLIPLGLDPHAFEPTPADVARIAGAQVVIMNGSGFEDWLAETLQNAGGQRLVIEASAGLTPRTPKPGEIVGDAHSGENPHGDPHFWLDPQLAIRYVENIRDGLIQVDPDGKDIYTQNATAYIEQLKALDSRIAEQLSAIPPQRRLLATNHESLGYFADRYGLTIIGTIIPSVSTSASPSAAQLAGLIDHLKQTGAPAIFLETGANPQLAEQIASETGVKVVTDLYTHSLSAPGGPAPSYIAMMEHDAQVILEALK
jgi:ABC-type Zn uptake system ZnuABC Zn-binding protein ZnuA